MVAALLLSGAVAAGVLLVDGGGSGGSRYSFPETAACLDEMRRYAAVTLPSPGTESEVGSEGSLTAVFVGDTGHVSLYFERSEADAERALERLRMQLPGYRVGRRGNVAYYATMRAMTAEQFQQEIDRVLECLHDTTPGDPARETQPELAVEPGINGLDPQDEATLWRLGCKDYQASLPGETCELSIARVRQLFDGAMLDVTTTMTRSEWGGGPIFGKRGGSTCDYVFRFQRTNDGWDLFSEHLAQPCLNSLITFVGTSADEN